MYLSKRLVNGIINQFEIATFFCFFSFGRLFASKTKKRSPEAMKNHFGTFVFKSYGLSYTVLYLFNVAMYKVNDAVVVLGVLVLKSTALNDFHRF